MRTIYISVASLHLSDHVEVRLLCRVDESRDEPRASAGRFGVLELRRTRTSALDPTARYSPLETASQPFSKIRRVSAPPSRPQRYDLHFNIFYSELRYVSCIRFGLWTVPTYSSAVYEGSPEHSPSYPRPDTSLDHSQNALRSIPTSPRRRRRAGDNQCLHVMEVHAAHRPVVLIEPVQQRPHSVVPPAPRNKPRKAPPERHGTARRGKKTHLPAQNRPTFLQRQRVLRREPRASGSSNCLCPKCLALPKSSRTCARTPQLDS